MSYPWPTVVIDYPESEGPWLEGWEPGWEDSNKSIGEEENDPGIRPSAVFICVEDWAEGEIVFLSARGEFLGDRPHSERDEIFEHMKKTKKITFSQHNEKENTTIHVWEAKPVGPTLESIEKHKKEILDAWNQYRWHAKDRTSTQAMVEEWKDEYQNKKESLIARGFDREELIKFIEEHGTKD